MFNFNPENGLLNTQEFPDKPSSGTVARNQFMRLFNQIKDYINGMETNGVKAKGGNADTLGGRGAGDYSLNGHGHSNYSTTDHNHNGVYANADHGHDYSPSWHNHDGKYANASHSHNYVEHSNWSNSAVKINWNNIFIQQGQPNAENTGDIWISW